MTAQLPIGTVCSHKGRKVTVEPGYWGMHPEQVCVWVVQDPIVIPRPREAVPRSELQIWQEPT